jgi:hypothetical protein
MTWFGKIKIGVKLVIIHRERKGRFVGAEYRESSRWMRRLSLSKAKDSERVARLAEL